MPRHRPVLALVVLGALGGAAWTWARRDTVAPVVERTGRAGAASSAPARRAPPPRGATAASEGRQAAHSLAVLDLALGEGWARCAPELEGRARPVFAALEDDWRALKPDLRPAWDAWQASRGVMIDAELLARCGDTFTHGSCDAVAAAWEECALPFVGTLALGDPCERGEQCALGACRLGRCAPPDECHSNDTCGAHMLCVGGELGNTTCVPAPLEGETCVVGWRCDEDQWCDDDGRCRAIGTVADGEPCDPRRTRCASRSWCLEGHCVDLGALEDALRPAPSEAPSTPPCSCRPFVDGTTCVDTDEGLACLPVRYAEVGEACDEEGVLCRGLLRTTWCRDGTCARAGGPDDACLDSAECRDHLRCVHERCREPLGPGEPCESHDACAFGLECVDEDRGGDAGEAQSARCGLARIR